MPSAYSVYVIDDDPDILTLVTTLLSNEGHQVSTRPSNQETLDEIRKIKPDCVITDIMMSGYDGMEICRQLRATPELDPTRIIVMSSKGYASDKNQALNLGANGYIRKPIQIDTFANQVTDIIEGSIKGTFWGVRGTLPVPGHGSLRYGGNTICVSLSFPHGPLFIFDAGSGIKLLSNDLIKNNCTHLDTYIFISHPHWDHINALPFFGPLYQPGHKIRILGARHSGIDMEHLISAQMDGIYFPITAREFAANVQYQSLQEGCIDIEGVNISTMLLHHPGQCLGYRVEYDNKVFCYITDNELYPHTDPNYDPSYFNKLAEFIKGADILVTDSTYTDDEYATRRDWGHSPISEVARLADKAQVKTLCLFHHDPDQDDNAIDGKHAFVVNALKDMNSNTLCLTPSEGDHFRL